jgi:hypothetical protein
MDHPEKLKTMSTEDTKSNQQWTIQKNWKQWAQKTQGAINNGPSRETENNEHRRHKEKSIMDHPEKLKTMSTEDTRSNQ